MIRLSLLFKISGRLARSRAACGRADDRRTAATNDNENYASFSVAVLTPTSRGNVTISSIDTNENPVVSPNWGLTSSDQELAVQGFKRARQFVAATGITVGPEYYPGSSTQPGTSNKPLPHFIMQALHVGFENSEAAFRATRA